VQPRRVQRRGEKEKEEVVVVMVMVVGIKSEAVFESRDVMLPMEVRGA
jgi:hypothetical protein